MERDDNDDSDAPEEFSVQQGLQQDEELRKLEKESKTRIAREGKDRRRRWAQRNTPQSSKGSAVNKEVTETNSNEEAQDTHGMLPNDIVQLLAAREKQVFLSESEEEEEEEKPARKKKSKRLGLEPVILKKIPPPRCLQNSLDFLKKRKMQVARSPSVLNNSEKALRFISTCGLLSKK